MFAVMNSIKNVVKICKRIKTCSTKGSFGPLSNVSLKRNELKMAQQNAMLTYNTDFERHFRIGQLCCNTV
jgi:hypothetical protein